MAQRAAGFVVWLVLPGCLFTTDLDGLGDGAGIWVDAGSDAGGPLTGPSCGEVLVCVSPPPVGIAVPEAHAA